MRRLLLGFSLVFFCCLFAFSGCRKADDVWPASGKKRVLVSFPPLYCFTKNVAGDDVEVRCLTTAQGPHDFQPNNNDVELARKADLILINGLGLDEWVNKMVKKGQGNAFELAEAIPEDQLKKMSAAEGQKGDDHGHQHGEHDPHVWLGPPQAKIMVEQIAAKLSELDPSHKKNFEERAQAYIKRLHELHEYGRAAFKDKKGRNIVAMHDSLQYFGLAFGVNVVGTIQLRAGEGTDPKALTQLIEICKDKGVRVIAVEPQYSKAAAETLKKELANKDITVALVEVDPLETAPAAATGNPDPAYYITKMKENIDNLAKALP